MSRQIKLCIFNPSSNHYSDFVQSLLYHNSLTSHLRYVNCNKNNIYNYRLTVVLGVFGLQCLEAIFSQDLLATLLQELPYDNINFSS